MANANAVMDAVDKTLERNEEQAAHPFSDQVRGIRRKLNLTQEEFCARFGIPLANLRNWEQTGRSTRPDTAARLLIAMIAVDPERVANIIATASRQSHKESQEVKGAA